MNLSPAPIKKRSPRTFQWAIFAAFALVLFGWIYYTEPAFLSDFANEKVTDAITVIAALMAAILSLKLTRCFQPSESPYRIWFFFTLGLCAWTLGEILDFIYDYYYWYTDLPDFTAMDVCWLLGYLFFGIALYLQFRVIYSHKKGAQEVRFVAYVALALLVTLILTRLAIRSGLGEGISSGVMYISISYPVFDLFEGAAALWLFFLFGRGYLGRPWWGLLAFSIADSISILDWLGGFNWMSDQAYGYLDLFYILLYLAAYMVTALAFLRAIDHLKINSQPDAPAAS